MNTIVTIIVGLAVLALFLGAVVFSIKSSKKISGCSGSCTGCPYSSGCEKAAGDNNGCKRDESQKADPGDSGRYSAK